MRHRTFSHRILVVPLCRRTWSILQGRLWVTPRGILLSSTTGGQCPEDTNTPNSILKVLFCTLHSTQTFKSRFYHGSGHSVCFHTFSGSCRSHYGTSARAGRRESRPWLPRQGVVTAPDPPMAPLGSTWRCPFRPRWDIWAAGGGPHWHGRCLAASCGLQRKHRHTLEFTVRLQKLQMMLYIILCCFGLGKTCEPEEKSNIHKSEFKRIEKM